MIRLENWEVVGWEHAIRGMRNPMNSWEKSDSTKINGTFKWHEIAPGCESLIQVPCDPYISIGENDHDLMMRLRNAGTDHRKFMRMITVYVDITAPMYWWKEADTYRVGVEKNSCSTMHKIHEKEFTLEDFSHEHLFNWDDQEDNMVVGADGIFLSSEEILNAYVITILNASRDAYLKTKDKRYWWQMIQLLPTSYNQKRTVMLNYEVLANIYKSRKNHKLDEWHRFCEWIEKLPYSELITGEKKDG